MVKGRDDYVIETKETGFSSEDYSLEGKPTEWVAKSFRWFYSKFARTLTDG